MSSRPQYDAFVVTAPGLEPLAVAELQAIGVSDARVTDGGATFAATRETLYESNLRLHTASRIVVRASEFGAKAFHELERRARKVPWEAFVSPNLGVSVRVTCRKSRLYHSDAVAERVASAIVSRVAGVRLGPEPESESDSDLDDSNDSSSQLILVRLLHDRCTISIDSSGALLHLRGYRQAVAKAPIRETLAAAAIMASGWTGDAPLIDPMCGSGTIPIEAALIARRIAPGLHRRPLELGGLRVGLECDLLRHAVTQVIAVLQTAGAAAVDDRHAVDHDQAVAGAAAMHDEVHPGLRDRTA
jgi:putative N6-adenine-specific DNA methylase